VLYSANVVFFNRNGQPGFSPGPVAIGITMSIQFWMVVVDKGNAPNVRHPTPQSASAEAERLAKDGNIAYVLEAVSKVYRPEVPLVTTNLRAFNYINHTGVTLSKETP
jgi:hypothetical protein